MAVTYAIAILGQLRVMSIMNDYPLTDGFKPFQWFIPFRLRLEEIGVEAYKAFQLAHNALYEIKFKISIVLDFMKDAKLILIQGSDFDVKEILPHVLVRIEDTAIECKKRSEGVAKAFKNVMNKILDLQQEHVQTKSVSEKELKRLQLQIMQQKLKQRQLKENKKRFEEQYDKVSANLDKYTKEYDKAMKGVSSDGDLLLYSFVDTCTNVISGVFSLFTFGILHFYKSGSSQQVEASSNSTNELGTISIQSLH